MIEHLDGCAQADVDLVQPWLGLAVSVVMLIVAAIVTRQPLPGNVATRAHVDGLGVLELTWLLGKDVEKTEKESEGHSNDASARRGGIAWQLVQAVHDPTLKNLRDEGKNIETAFCD